MRNRIEDLGRLSVMINQLLDSQHEFEEIYSGRKKDFVEWFYEQTRKKKRDILHRLIYDRQQVLDDLSDMSEIAEGTDRLNREDDGI